MHHKGTMGHTHVTLISSTWRISQTKNVQKAQKFHNKSYKEIQIYSSTKKWYSIHFDAVMPTSTEDEPNNTSSSVDIASIYCLQIWTQRGHSDPTIQKKGITIIQNTTNHWRGDTYKLGHTVKQNIYFKYPKKRQIAICGPIWSPGVSERSRCDTFKRNIHINDILQWKWQIKKGWAQYKQICAHHKIMRNHFTNYSHHKMETSSSIHFAAPVSINHVLYTERIRVSKYVIQQFSEWNSH